MPAWFFVVTAVETVAQLVRQPLEFVIHFVCTRAFLVQLAMLFQSR